MNTDALGSYLARRLDCAVTATGVTVLNDGLNLTLSVSTTRGEYVVRRPNEFRSTPLFADLRVEYEALERLADASVPVGRPVLLCEDESVLGGPFLVREHLPGETVPLGSALPERFRNPDARRAFAERVIDGLVAVHSVPVEPFADVCEHVPPGEQLERTVEWLTAARAATDLDPLRVDDVVDRLREVVPPDPETTLVHGDYRPGNLLFAPTAEPTITGVIDWETVALGDPLTELGYLLLRWRDPGDPAPSLDPIEARHPAAAVESLRAWAERGMAPFTSEPGSPTRAELVDRYERETGTAAENLGFHVGLSALGLLTVWANLYRERAEDAGVDATLPARIDYVSLLAHSVLTGATDPV
ncbi:phosphotransferase family protein [Halobacteriales archaeon SW_7_71_33]|nr:MAG: phosphotransferase family protein [Halobacteriales archaeon SW_7_71_33]